MLRKCNLCTLLAVIFLLLASSAASAEVVGTEHWFKKDGIDIYIWEKCDGQPVGKPVVILAHGSATAGRDSFDLQVPKKPSYSLMDFLARKGFDVFAPDVRGFGRSTHPDGGVNTAQASEDLNNAVDYVLNLRKINKINLLAWSWGTQYAGLFVMFHPDKVAKYVSYAQMHVNSPDIAMRKPKIEVFKKNPYVKIPESSWKPRFYSMTPASANDPQVVDAFAKTAAQVETRTATGPQLDLCTILPIVNPKLIPAPTMIIHGEYDDVADLKGLLPFFAQLPNPYKRYVVVPDAGHMMMFQKGHVLFQHEVASFFSNPE